MKKLYSFTVNTPKEIDEIIEKTNESGEKIKVVEKVKKDNFQNYFISKPSISTNHEMELFYESIVSDCIKRGIMSQVQIKKRLLNDGGVLSDEQKSEYNSLWDKLYSLRADYNKLNDEPEKNKEKMEKINKETTETLVKLQDFEEKHGGSIYEHTAENIARNRTALWLMLHLSHKEINGKEIPYFGDGGYVDKFKKYEEIEKEEDEEKNKILEKFLLATSLYYFRGISKQQDFDEIFKMKDLKDAKT